MENILSYFQAINSYLWGPPMLILLLGAGFYLTVSLKGLQFKTLLSSLYLALIKRKEENSEGDITHFQALMTALAATVGTGNIAGVATAIAIGGPGALFWMWMTGFLGMATKYSEAVLAVYYREKDEKGEMRGGPMYYILKGMNNKWLAYLFAFFASIAAFGIGNMVQSNSVADAANHSFSIPHYVTGLFLALFTGLVIIGGIKSIGKTASFIVPFMIVFYSLGCLAIVFLNFHNIPNVFMLIIKEAFTDTAAIGGFAGSSVLLTIRMGVARGIFSNESGLGSAPIAAAAAQSKHPVSQALVSMTQTFIDTIIVCSLTGFAILSTGEWTGGKTGAALTSASFAKALPGNFGDIIVSLGIIFFAYSTILGWYYYGEKSIEFLLGSKVKIFYKIFFTIAVFIGSVLKLDLVWEIADTMNALMALPNLIALFALSKIIKKVTEDYFASNYLNKK